MPTMTLAVVSIQPRSKGADDQLPEMCRRNLTAVYSGEYDEKGIGETEQETANIEPCVGC